LNIIFSEGKLELKILPEKLLFCEELVASIELLDDAGGIKVELEEIIGVEELGGMDVLETTMGIWGVEELDEATN
jgi:hypothetical protein